MAVAHSILVIIYHLLRDRTSYQERGETFFEERDRQITEQRLIRQLERLGNQVTIEPLNQAGECCLSLARRLFQKRRCNAFLFESVTFFRITHDATIFIRKHSSWLFLLWAALCSLIISSGFHGNTQ